MTALLRAVLSLIGAVTGLLATVVHRHVWFAGGIDWPWGLVLGVVVTFCVTLAGDALVRGGSAFVALGWAVLLLVQLVTGGDSYLIAQDGFGWAFVTAGIGALAAAMWLSTRLPGSPRFPRAS